MKALKYVIVDDQDLDRLAIEACASAFPFLEKTAAFAHPLEALEFLTKFDTPIVFADIEMPGMTGLDMIKTLQGRVAAPVFITSHPEFALESYDMEAFDYLLKPVNAERFGKCAQRLRDFFQLREDAYAFAREQEHDAIVVKQGHDKYKVLLNDIIYLEAMKDYVAIVTASRKYLVLATLAGMQEKLPAARFARVHRSYIVHIEKIQSQAAGKIVAGGHELPVGKLYKQSLSSLL